MGNIVANPITYVAGVAGYFIYSQWQNITTFLRECLCASYTTNTYENAVALDHYVMQHSSTFRRDMDEYRLADGMHLLWENWLTPTLLIRSTTHHPQDEDVTNYDIICPSFLGIDGVSAIRNLRNQARREQLQRNNQRDGNEERPENIYFLNLNSLTHRNAWSHTLSRKVVQVPTVLFQYQMELVDQIVRLLDKPTESITVLICGLPGTGKTIVSRLLGVTLADRNPFIVENFNPMINGLSFEQDVLRHRHSEERLMILLIDEIDVAMKYSRQDNAANDFNNHAHSKITMTNFMDSLKDTRKLITICTSNTPLEDLTRDYPEYVRRGRVDISVTFNE